jgi:HSP20 family protein
MAPVKWDFYNDLMTLKEKINHLFDDSMMRGRLPVSGSAAAWSPAVDAWETDSAFVVTAEVPGVLERSIDVRFKDGMLSLRGTREMEPRQGAPIFHRLERFYGAFYRSLAISGPVDAQRMSVRCSQGLLTISLPKKKKRQKTP